MPTALLAIETATDVCSVAVAEDERVLAEVRLHRPRAHAERLVPMIGEVLAHMGWAASRLDVVALSSGPGSYTGLRIGASTAKGLAWAAEAHLVAVPSLEAQAAAALPLAPPGDVVCAAFSARRNEVFAAAFRVTPNATLEPLFDTAALSDDAVPAWLNNVEDARVWLVGEGAPRVAVALGALQTYRLLTPEAFPPSAAWVARQAWPRIADASFEDVATFEPFYLKAFVAKKARGSIFERLPF